MSHHGASIIDGASPTFFDEEAEEGATTGSKIDSNVDAEETFRMLWEVVETVENAEDEEDGEEEEEGVGDRVDEREGTESVFPEVDELASVFGTAAEEEEDEVEEDEGVEVGSVFRICCCLMAC